MSHLHFKLQVAFASDFTSEWKSKELGLSKHSLGFLVGLTFKGAQKRFENPLYQVSIDVCSSMCVYVRQCMGYAFHNDTYIS